MSLLARIADWTERAFIDGPSRAAALRELIGIREQRNHEHMERLMASDAFKDYLRTQMTHVIGLPRVMRPQLEIPDYEEAMFTCVACRGVSGFIIAWPVTRTISCAHCKLAIMVEKLATR